MRHRPQSRAAFTLVELLVVIAIIAILASLAAWGVFAMIGNTQRNNTQATLRVVNKLLQDRWTAVIADARKEAPSPQVVALAGGPLLDPTGERAKVIWIKVRLAEAFPVSYQEVRAPAPLPAPQTLVSTYIPATMRKPYFLKYQQLIGAVPSGGVGESSACLLMALKTLGSDGPSIEDQLKFAVKDTDGDTLNELVDGWSTPLAFFRFGWNNAGFQAANPGAGNQRGLKYADPVDTGGSLINATWYNLPPPPPPPILLSLRQTYEAQFLPVSATPPIAGGSPLQSGAGNAYYVAPVVVSAGKDQKMDLLSDLSVGGVGAADNIFSFQLRGE